MFAKLCDAFIRIASDDKGGYDNHNIKPQPDLGLELAWGIFEQSASRYKACYSTERGQRADIAEYALLEWLLRQPPNARTVVPPENLILGDRAAEAVVLKRQWWRE